MSDRPAPIESLDLLYGITEQRRKQAAHDADLFYHLHNVLGLSVEAAHQKMREIAINASTS